jgi:hypothetical protein
MSDIWKEPYINVNLRHDFLARNERPAMIAFRKSYITFTREDGSPYAQLLSRRDTDEIKDKIGSPWTLAVTHPDDYSYLWGKKLTEQGSRRMLSKRSAYHLIWEQRWRSFTSLHLMVCCLRSMVDGRRGVGVSLTKMKVPRFKWGISHWRSVTCFPHVMTKKNVPRYISRSVLAAGRVPGLSSSCFGGKSTFVPGDSSRFLAFLFWRVIVPSHWAWPRFLYLGTSEFDDWRAVYYPIST